MKPLTIPFLLATFYLASCVEPVRPARGIDQLLAQTEPVQLSDDELKEEHNDWCRVSASERYEVCFTDARNGIYRLINARIIKSRLCKTSFSEGTLERDLCVSVINGSFWQSFSSAYDKHFNCEKQAEVDYKKCLTH